MCIFGPLHVNSRHVLVQPAARIGCLASHLLLHVGRRLGSSDTLTAAVRLGQALRSLGQKRAGSTAEATVGAH